MTPHRSNNRGTLLIDRQFPMVGRIRRASGTTSPRVLRSLNAMLDGFRDQGRRDLLESIRDGQFSPLYAFSWFREGRVDRIPAADVLAPLRATWDAWIGNLKASPSHKASLRKTGRALGLREDHILNDLPSRLSAYRETAPPHSSNQARVHAQAFLRDTLGKSHRLWVAVKDMAPAKKPKTVPRPIPSVDEIRRLVVQLGERAGEAAWSLFAMGMIPKEYWTDGWEEMPDRIRSHGQKRTGRTRDIPRWTKVVQPPLGFSTFRKKLRLVTEGRWRPTDFRRAFARSLEEADIMESHRKCYLGHGARNMTQLYTMGEVSGQLDGDAEKLRAYTGEPSAPVTLRRMA
jgi:hypothetical protein